MAEVAPSLPLPRSLLAHISDETLQQALLPRYEALVDRARAARPEPGSATEHEHVRELALLLFEVLERLGHHAMVYLRSDVQGQLDALIHDELRSADVTRKLALRHLQGSVGVAGHVIELGGEVFRGLPDVAVEALLGEIGESTGHAERVEEHLDDDLHAFLSWWLSLIVALECTLGNLEDLTYWSRRTIEGSRKVEALLPRLTSDLRAARLQLRARWAWHDWDEEDIEDEIAAWRKLSE